VIADDPGQRTISKAARPRDVLAALAAVSGALTAGVGQPLLDLYGKNPTMFVAAFQPSGRVVLFALLVVLVPPGAWLAVALIARTRRELLALWRVVGLGVGYALAALVICVRLGLPDIATVAGALGAATLLTLLVTRVRAARSIATLMGFLTPLVLATFLFVSPASALVLGHDAVDVALPTAKLTSRPTIVWIVLDEANLAMLLDRSGALDASRYPNLAALAGTSTWYRNAIGMDNQTQRAVPGLLASRFGTAGTLPNAGSYPTNAFSLLDRAYRIDAFEPVTNLCVSSRCLDNPLHAPHALRSVLSDAAVAYGTLVLPEFLRSRLPPTDTAWGGFEALPENRKAVDPFAKVRHVSWRYPDVQLEVAGTFIDRIRAHEPPTLHFLHALLPHRPWFLAPDGTRVDDPEVGADGGRVPADPWRAQTSAAEYALQAGAADLVVGRLIARLKATGLWDSTLVVLSADHGINFSPGEMYRSPAKQTPEDELYSVPMIVHTPGQRSGAVVDAPTSTVDLLPTVFGVLGVAPLPTFEGVDLAHVPASTRVRQVDAFEKPAPYPLGIDAVLARRRVYDAWFPSTAQGWAPIFARGRYRDLLGTRVASTATATDARLVSVHAPSPHAVTPTSWVGIDLVVDHPIDDGAIVVARHGVVVGFLGGVHTAGPGFFEGVVDWRGDNALTFYLASGDPTSPTLARIR
jgi:hypothetical protein